MRANPIRQPVAPEPWLLEIWRCWWTLHPSRPTRGGGLGPAIPEPIAFRDLVLWADAHGFADLELLQRCVAAMDRVFLAHWAAEETQRQARERSRQGGRRGR